MVIINKSDSDKYSTIAHRNLAPGQKSADMDMAGFKKALSEVIRSCGSACCIRLNDEEKKLVKKFLALVDAGSKFTCKASKSSSLSIQMLKEEQDKQAKMASIRAEQDHEEAIRSETTYASRKDVANAQAKSGLLKGEVKAKKLDTTKDALSLNDLMGDNKFIEESMKHSKIRTAVASEDGWDMAKIKEANTAATTSTTKPAEAKTTATATATVKSEKAESTTPTTTVAKTRKGSRK